MRAVLCIPAVVLFFLTPSSERARYSSLTVMSHPDDSIAIRVFAQIKRFEGEWKGTYEWTGGRVAKGKMDARYYQTGMGSALVEDLLIEGKPMMTSVYHLDGNSLRMTHFCGVNQPRLHATIIDEGKRKIHFGFVDATNLLTPTDPHVCGLDLEFPDKDRISLVFDFIASGTHSYEHIGLVRAS